MRNLLSDLLQLTMRFLEQRKERSDNRLYLLQELNRRGLESLFTKHFKKFSDELDAMEVKDESYYQARMKIEQTMVSYIESHKRDIVALDKTEQSIVDNALNGFFALVLRSYAYMINQRRTLLKHEYKLPMLEEILRYLDLNDKYYEEIPYINIYRYMILLMLNPMDEPYLKFKSLIRQHHRAIQRRDLKDAYTVLLNYGQEQIHKSREEFHKEVFELDREIFERKVYRKGDFITPVFFHNTIIHCLNLKEFEWCLKFIEYYKNILLKDYKESSYNYVMALLSFGRKEYGKALEFLARVKTEEFSYKLDIKSLQLRIY